MPSLAQKRVSVSVPVKKKSLPRKTAVPSRDSPRIYFLLRARGSHGLLKNLITIAWVHGDVAITVKNDGWDNWPAI